MPDEYYVSDNVTAPSGRKANAAIVMLGASVCFSLPTYVVDIVCAARNSDLNGVVVSMKQMEDRFNKKFGYPYVFLNEEDFTDNFKKYPYIQQYLSPALIQVH